MDEPRRLPRLVLASASPRRRQIFERLGLPCRFDPAELDEESLVSAKDPAEKAARVLASAKAREIAPRAPGCLVVGADTIVAAGGAMLGKPEDDEHARRMLRSLSGRSHTVVTAVTVVDVDRRQIVGDVSCTTVRMKALAPEEIDAYVRTGEPRGKAGSYAIQGRGELLVESIEGSYSNVVGLPIHLLDVLLARLGYSIWDFML